MIHATIRMALPAQKTREALDILCSVAERTRVQPGCVSCRIYQDAQEENVIMVDELWKRQEEHECYLRSAEYRNVLLVMEMACETPEIKFNEVSGSSGLETIEKARR